MIAIEKEMIATQKDFRNGVGGSAGNDAHPRLAGVARDPEHLEISRIARTYGVSAYGVAALVAAFAAGC